MSFTTLIFMSFSSEIIYSFKILFQVEIVWISKFKSFWKFWSSYHVTLFERFKIWNSNNFNLKQYFERVNDFSWKTHEYQSCRTHQYVQLLFWSYFHLTKFEQLKFWISLNSNFKQDFKTLNDFNNKSHEHKSCWNPHYLQLLFWPLLHMTKY